jgi:hypothetical protein
MESLIVGVTGAQTYENKRKIRDFLFLLKKEENVKVVSLGDVNGADKYVKKYALELGLQYGELNAPHTNKNLYSIMGEGFHGKPYAVKNFHLQSTIYTTYVTRCAIFTKDNNDKKVKSLVAKLKKIKKPFVLIN